MQYHDLRAYSISMINFENVSVNGTVYTGSFSSIVTASARAHGCLMVIAWMMVQKNLTKNFFTKINRILKFSYSIYSI